MGRGGGDVDRRGGDVGRGLGGVGRGGGDVGRGGGGVGRGGADPSQRLMDRTFNLLPSITDRRARHLYQSL